MIWTDFLCCRGSLVLILALGLSPSRAATQGQEENLSHLPTSFSAEDDKFPNAVPLPVCVRSLLAIDPHVVNTLKYKHLSPTQLPADWFTASERELGQSNGRYLVVMGADLMRGANINPFWIFHQSSNSCDLLLTIGAHDLEVLKARTNGLPDIKTVALTAVRYFENQYSFDGKSYQIVKRTSKPIGDEVPRDLSDFETRTPLVQRPEQSSAPILDQARAWLWRQWRLEKPSYLRVTLHSKEGDEITTTYFIRKVGPSVDVVIQTHRIVVDRAPNSGTRRPVVEDETLVAGNVERRLALKDNPDRKVNVPENQDASPDSYELYFNDISGNNLAVL